MTKFIVSKVQTPKAQKPGAITITCVCFSQKEIVNKAGGKNTLKPSKFVFFVQGTRIITEGRSRAPPPRKPFRRSSVRLTGGSPKHCYLPYI